LNLLRLFLFLIPEKYMPKLPVVRAKNLIKALEKIGFRQIRQSGSHVFLMHKDGRCTTIPIHGKRDIPNGTFRGILNDIKVSKEEIIASLSGRK